MLRSKQLRNIFLFHRLQNQVRLLQTEESPEVWFTDYGSGQLINGQVTINFDPTFAGSINMNNPYHVFIQLEGPCTGGVYVANKTATGFTVVQQDATTSNAAFSYRITGKRKHFENLRFATEEESKVANNNMVQQVWPEVITYRNQQQQIIDAQTNSELSSPVQSTMPQLQSTPVNDSPVNNPSIPAIAPMTPRNYPASPTPNITHP